MKIKKTKLQLLVSVTIECTAPESFTSQAEFDKEDGKAMQKYVAERIREVLNGAWQYAARASKVTVKPNSK